MSRSPDWSVAPAPRAVRRTTYAPEVQIHPTGRWSRELVLTWKPSDINGPGWISTESVKRWQVLGDRWARWKARRLLAGALRSTQ